MVLKIPQSCVRHVTQVPQRLKSRLTPIDIEIVTLTQATVLNYIMTPIIGAVDTYWISRLNHDAALAGEGTADRIFGSIYSIASFAPSIVTPLVSKYHVTNNETGLVQTVTTSTAIVGILGTVTSLLMFIFTKPLMKLVIPPSSDSLVYANQYFSLRSLSFVFALLNSLAFSVYRGQKNLGRPMRINLLSQVLNAVLDPIFMSFMGVRGVALGTLISEVVGCVLFYSHLYKSNLIQPIQTNLKIAIDMIKTGFSVQLRAICLSLVYVMGFRRAQHLDLTGSVVAAHVLNIQVFEFGYIFTRSLGMVCSILVPRYKHTKEIKHVTKRLYAWGLGTSTVVSVVHLCLGSAALSMFSQTPNVLNIAKDVIPIATLFQFIYGLTSLTEGIAQGNEQFGVLGTGSVVTLVLFSATHVFTKSLNQLWLTMCFSTIARSFFTLVRDRHQNLVRNRQHQNRHYPNSPPRPLA